jgi:hypothetical protein
VDVRVILSGGVAAVEDDSRERASVAQDGATSCEQAVTAIGDIVGAIVGGGAGFVGGGLAGGAAGTVTLPGVGSVSGASWGAYAGARGGALVGGSGGKSLGDTFGPFICGWLNPSSGGTGGAGGASAGNVGLAAPTTEGPVMGGPSNEQNPSMSVQSTGGRSNEQNPSSTTQGTGQQSSGDTSGGNDPEDTTCHFPNPEDFPDPDDSRGFQLPTFLMSTAMAAPGSSERAGQNGYEVSLTSAPSAPASALRIIQAGVKVRNVGSLVGRGSAEEG